MNQSYFGSAIEAQYWQAIGDVENAIAGKDHHEKVTPNTDVQYWLDKKEDLGNLIINSVASENDAEENAQIRANATEIYTELLSLTNGNI